MGHCAEVMVDRVLAEQTFTCIGELVSFPPGFTVGDITFTQIQVSCAPVFATPAGIAITFSVSGTIEVLTPGPFVYTFTGEPVSGGGTFCGLAVPVTDQPLVDCGLVQLTGITAMVSVDPDSGAVIVTATAIGEFALVQKVTLTVALCSGGNTAVVGIPATPCRDGQGETPDGR